MPLPLLLIGISVAAAAVGAKKGVDARADGKRAEAMTAQAEAIFESARQVILKSRSRTSTTLTDLGRLKLEVWEMELARFAELYGRLHPIEMISRIDIESGRQPVTTTDVGHMRELASFAHQALASGGLALGAGALAGVAAYGGAVMFATASTGTAISALAGAAATNATLAWFGGGALTAGGMGMAGGVAVLGGLIAGPVLAVGGIVWAAMAKENLAKARASLADSERAAAEMRTAASILDGDGIARVAAQFAHAILAVRGRFQTLLDALDEQSRTVGTNYREYTREQRALVHVVVQAAQTIKALLETPFLTPEGALRPDFHFSLNAATFAQGALETMA